MPIDLDSLIYAVPCGVPGDVNALSGRAHICEDRMSIAVTECLETQPGQPCPACSGVTPLIFDCRFVSTWPACVDTRPDNRVEVLAGHINVSKALRQDPNNPCWWQKWDTSIRTQNSRYPSWGGICEGEPDPPQEVLGVTFTLGLIGQDSWLLQIYSTIGIAGGVLPFDGNCDQTLVFTNYIAGTNYGTQITCVPRVG